MAIKLPNHVYSPKAGNGEHRKSDGAADNTQPLGARQITPGERLLGACQTAELPIWGPRVRALLWEPGCRGIASSQPQPDDHVEGSLIKHEPWNKVRQGTAEGSIRLLLGLRSQPQARKLLGQAVTFLRMLEHQGEPGGLPLVVSVQVMRLRKY